MEEWKIAREKIDFLSIDVDGNDFYFAEIILKDVNPSVICVEYNGLWDYETNFVMKVDKGDLKCYFGDIGTHSGNFVFQSQVNGSLSRPLIWPIKVFQSIMDLPGDKTIRLSDQGVAEIVVDSGLGVYYYRLPAQTK